MDEKRYRLLNGNGTYIESADAGKFGGNRRLRIYGRLDCSSARRALSRGYAMHRVFFADEASAVAAGYRPCGVCMRAEYAQWRSATNGRTSSPVPVSLGKSGRDR